jgi:hypothetical protein
MNTRVNPFANLSDPPVFTTKEKPRTPVQKETIERIATENNFPSRQAAKSSSAVRRKPRIYRTGRNQQFNAKATPETIARFYKLANEKNVPLGELLRLALDALDREGLVSRANLDKVRE